KANQTRCGHRRICPSCSGIQLQLERQLIGLQRDDFANLNPASGFQHEARDFESGGAQIEPSGEVNFRTDKQKQPGNRSAGANLTAVEEPPGWSASSARGRGIASSPGAERKNAISIALRNKDCLLPNAA